MEDVSGRLFFYGVFGIGLLLTAIQGLAFGQIKLITREWGVSRYFEGQSAFWIGLLYLVIGLIYCLIAYQLLTGIRPTLVHTFADVLNMEYEKGEAIFFVGSFFLIFMPHIFGQMFIKS